MFVASYIRIVKLDYTQDLHRNQDQIGFLTMRVTFCLSTIGWCRVVDRTNAVLVMIAGGMVYLLTLSAQHIGTEPIHEAEASLLKNISQVCIEP